MDFLRNLVLNLKATGPAAVVCVWFISIAALGIFGGPNSGLALGALSGGGMLVLFSLINRSDR